ncbi:hypothetical protein VTI74DRAFT_3811 [Chaetomium olivicolor]
MRSQWPWYCCHNASLLVEGGYLLNPQMSLETRGEEMAAAQELIRASTKVILTYCSFESLLAAVQDQDSFSVCRAYLVSKLCGKMVNKVACFTQDPVYTGVDRRVLRQAGFALLDDRGGGGST